MNKLTSRGGKYKAHGPKNTQQDSVKILGLDDVIMNTFCSYVLSTNPTIHNYSLFNLNKLINSIDESRFENNPLLMQKYKFLLVALHARVTKGLTGNFLLDDINNHMDASNIINDPSIITEVRDTEVSYIEQAIADYLNTMAFDSHLDNLMNLCNTYASAEFRDRKITLGTIRTEISNIMSEFRKHDVEETSPTTRFRLTKMKESVDEIHSYVSSPSFKLITGMKGFNDILGGGFQKTRLYCLFSLAGEGKTVTLVNLLYQTWKYNKGYQTKDPTKKPCIVLLTMENLVIEYICSLFHVITRGKDIKSCSTGEDVLQEFKARKFEYAADDDIEIVIDYKPVNTKDTRYMYEMVEELEEEGFETIAFFMDYLMRIRPSEYTKDIYIDLGTVANDFKTFAILKDIPVITASQLNREAAKIVDEGRSNQKSNLVQKLGRATIGDSINIDRNIDCSIILIPESINDDKERYMGFKLTKARYELTSSLRSFYQPMYPGSKITFQEDLFELGPKYKETLDFSADLVREKIGPTQKYTTNPSLTSLQDLAFTAAKQLVEDTYEEPRYAFPADKLVEKKLKTVVDIIPIEDRKLK